MANLSMAETLDKKLEIMRLGGNQILAADSALQEVLLHLPVPFSKIRALARQLPLDASLINNQGIQVVLYLKSGTAVFGGSGAAGYAGLNTLTSGEFSIRQGQFDNRRDSLKDELNVDPGSYSYSYPFCYYQSQQILAQTGVVSGSGLVSVSLVGFRAGQLEAIQFAVNLNTNEVPAGTDSKNNFDYDDISNIRVVYNGQVLWQSNGKLAKLYMMEQDLTPAYTPNGRISAGATSPFTSTQVQSYFYTIPFSQFSPCLDNSANMQSGIDIGANQLVLQFNTTTTGVYNVYLNYIYPALIKFSGGDAEFVF